MLFEVVKNDGRGNYRGVMCTDYESCIYIPQELENMHSAGYDFKVNGKLIELSDGDGLISKKVQKAVRAALKAGVGFPMTADSPVPEEKESTPQPAEKPAGKRVMCVDTGDIFNTQSEAARHFNIDPAQVSDSIKTGRPRSGYTFKRCE